MLLQTSFLEQVERQPARTALVTEEERFTYRELGTSVSALAATLQARGVRRGDRVAIYLPNGVELVVALFAALRVGAAFMPISSQTRTRKLRYLLGDAAPSCLVTDGALAPRWLAAAEGLTGLRSIVATRATGRGDPRLVRWEDALSSTGQGLKEPGTIDQDLAALLYTSGSTGEPRGVMLTHLNMRSAAGSIVQYLGLRDDDVIHCALPLSFDYGLYQVLMGLSVGATVVLERSFLFAGAVLERLDKERCTVFPGVPTLFALMLALERPWKFRLERLRLLTSTGAALPERHIRELCRAFPRATLYSMYGLTECKRVSYLPPDELDRRPGSVGRGMPNEEVYLVDELGRRLPNGSVGELVVRGSHVMRGYWNQPKETSQRLRPGPYPGERVLYTGDLFRTDGEGFLYFVGRKDEVIKSRGEKVSPREVEDVLCALPGVQEAAVLGASDPILGEAVHAYVVLRPGATLTTGRILRHCAEHLEAFMVPRHVVFAAQLPRSPNGKVDKQALRAGPSAPAVREEAAARDA